MTSNTCNTCNTCNICCELYNKSNRAKVCCPYCDYDVCRLCCETYMMNETIPKCMKPECAKEWSRKFLRENFTNTFLTTKYREHIENILFEQEKALMPATQPIVEEKIRKKNIIAQIKELDVIIENLQKKKRNLERTLNLPESNSAENSGITKARFVRQCPANGCRGFLSSVWKCGICERWTCPDCHELKGFDRDCEHICDTANLETAKLLAKDTKPCPKCQSLIFKISGCFAKDTPILMWDKSVKMSQDICIGDVLVGDDGKPRVVEDLVTGEDDLYAVEQSRGITYVVNSKHSLLLGYFGARILVIDVDNYLKLEEGIKCRLLGYKSSGVFSSISVAPRGRGIYYGWRVNGNKRFLLEDLTVVKNCDQMWCTQCHTAFSWKTGQVEKNIHNPHYYEWQRKHGGEINGVGVGCGRELNHIICEHIEAAARRHTLLIRSYLEPYNNKQMYKTSHFCDSRITMLTSIVRNTIHNLRVVMPGYQTNYVEKNLDLRVRYMENVIDEEEFKILIQRNDRKNKKNNEIVQVIQVSNSALTEIIYRIIDHLKNCGVNDFNPGLDSMLCEIHEMREYCNSIFKDIAFTYSTVQYSFNQVFEFEKERKLRK